MKIIFLFVLSLNIFASSIKLETKVNNELIDGLIVPLWQTIPYRYDFGNKSNMLSNEISYTIEQGNLLLAPNRVPIFNIKIQNDNKVSLKWNLQNAAADVLVKIRFKFKQFGIQITHDEYFKADLSTIKAAYSTLEISSGTRLQFRHLSSVDFQFENISVVARDGIGSTLRYILDNIFSKREVDALIKNAINNNMQQWINNSELIKNAENQINQNISENLKRKRELPHLASTISFDLKKIGLNQSKLSLEIDPHFHDDYNIHECAKDIAEKGEIDISRSIFEKVLENLTMNEIIVNSQIVEPILCLGYKANQDGAITSLAFLKKNIDFKLWLRPSEKIKYSYQSNNIQIELNLFAEILTQKYPHIYLANDQLLAKSTLKFNISLNQKGLVLTFLDLKIKSITGRAHVKWTRFLPRVRLPLNIIATKLESEISKSLKDQFENFVLLEREFEINSNYKAELKTYINDGSFNVGFDIK
jgi:hypothetical protein